MSELSELYQQVILDHNKKPRNYRELEDANRISEGHNPLCGDQLTVQLRRVRLRHLEGFGQHDDAGRPRQDAR